MMPLHKLRLVGEFEDDTNVVLTTRRLSEAELKMLAGQVVAMKGKSDDEWTYAEIREIIEAYAKEQGVFVEVEPAGPDGYAVFDMEVVENDLKYSRGVRMTGVS